MVIDAVGSPTFRLATADVKYTLMQYKDTHDDVTCTNKCKIVSIFPVIYIYIYVTSSSVFLGSPHVIALL